jgi:hypothetical protein
LRLKLRQLVATIDSPGAAAGSNSVPLNDEFGSRGCI